MTALTSAPPASEPSSRAVPWLLAAAFAAAASIYAPVAATLVRQWYEDPGAAYGGLVAGAAALALRQRLPRLRSLSRRTPSPPGGTWPSVIALAGAAVAYTAGTLAADVFLLRASLVMFTGGSLWFVYGAAYLRVLGAPLVLLAAAIPLPSAVVTELTMPLQLAASRCAAELIALAGVEVARDGNVLTLDYITLEVAEACSGMRSLVTLVALVAVYWGLSGATVWRFALLAAATVPVALAGNGLRVAATALLASRIGERAVEGAIHEATGVAAFAVMCGMLAGVHALASRLAAGRERAA